MEILVWRDIAVIAGLVLTLVTIMLGLWATRRGTPSDRARALVQRASFRRRRLGRRVRVAVRRSR